MATRAAEAEKPRAGTQRSPGRPPSTPLPAAEGGAGPGRGRSAPTKGRRAHTAPPADWLSLEAGPPVQTRGGACLYSSRAAALAVGPARSTAPPYTAPRSPRAARVRLRGPPGGGAGTGVGDQAWQKEARGGA